MLYKELFKVKGWDEDRWGNLKLNDFRLKFQKISLRFEHKVGKRWFKITSQYYTRIDTDFINRIDDRVKKG